VLCLFNYTTGQVNEIKNFLPDFGTKNAAVPLRAVYRDNGKTVFCVFVIEEIINFALHQEGNTETEYFLMSELIPQSRSSDYS